MERPKFFEKMLTLVLTLLVPSKLKGRFLQIYGLLRIHELYQIMIESFMSLKDNVRFWGTFAIKSIHFLILKFLCKLKRVDFWGAFSFIFFTYIKKIELEQSTFLVKLLNYKTFNAICRLWTHCCIWWRTMDLKKQEKKEFKVDILTWIRFGSVKNIIEIMISY